MELIMDIFDFEPNLIEFTAHKMLSATVLWVDLPNLDTDIKRPFGKWTSDEFMNAYAYAIKGNELFGEISFSTDDVARLSAEIYGGGRNGGAGRCGNLGKVQVKGVGKTALIGKVVDHWHSYGGFSLQEAMLEVLNSVVLSKILPCGAAKCYGLILTGNHTAMQPMQFPSVTGRGAIIVRESCLRPAHFFANDKFIPTSENKHKFRNDKLRLKLVTRKLSLILGDVDGFWTYLKSFLDNCANQFAYSKLFRIFHGAINATNISLDGRWLDLTNASFVNAGKNYIGSKNIPSFYAEHCTVLNFIDKLLKNYQFYNGNSPQKDALTTFYCERFSHYIKVHFLDLIGLAAVDLSIAEDKDISLLSSKIWDSIIRDVEPISELPYEAVNDDPTIVLLEQWFSSAYKWFSYGLEFGCNNHSDVDAALYRLLKRVIESSSAHTMGELNSIVIRSLRMAYFSEFFFRKRVETVIRENINTPDLSYFTEMIEIFRRSAQWIFQDSNDQSIVICSLKILQISFDKCLLSFSVTIDDRQLSFSSPLDLLGYVNQLEEKYFIVNDYSFKRGTIKICKVIAYGFSCIENCVVTVQGTESIGE
jgi:hypothetical protein